MRKKATNFLDALAGCKRVVDTKKGRKIKCGDFVNKKYDSDKIFCNDCHKIVSKFITEQEDRE